MCMPTRRVVRAINGGDQTGRQPDLQQWLFPLNTFIVLTTGPQAHCDIYVWLLMTN